MSFGQPDNLEEGDEFTDQRELYRLGLHGDRQQGIHGWASRGAESVVLSGGYEEDSDFGDEIIYTGMTPGTWDRERRTTSGDQELSGKNLALVRNIELDIPLRVFRSHNHKSKWSPPQGIRYAGLYRVTKYWHTHNKSGHLIYQFKLEKLDKPILNVVKEGSPPRIQALVSQVVRNPENVIAIRELYNCSCQVCGTALPLPTGPYAEACHIRPLGRPHNGTDEVSNMLCLCPNHHVLLDAGAFTILDNLLLKGLNGKLTTAKTHNISTESLQYHRTHIFISLAGEE